MGNWRINNSITNNTLIKSLDDFVISYEYKGTHKHTHNVYGIMLVCMKKNIHQVVVLVANILWKLFLRRGTNMEI